MKQAFASCGVPTSKSRDAGRPGNRRPEVHSTPLRTGRLPHSGREDFYLQANSLQTINLINLAGRPGICGDFLPFARIPYTYSCTTQPQMPPRVVDFPKSLTTENPSFAAAATLGTARNSGQLSAISHHEVAVSGQLSAVSHHEVAVSGQPSRSSCQRSAVSDQPPLAIPVACPTSRSRRATGEASFCLLPVKLAGRPGHSMVNLTAT